eukprot:54164-Amphidinium_carterae.1
MATCTGAQSSTSIQGVPGVSVFTWVSIHATKLYNEVVDCQWLSVVSQKMVGRSSTGVRFRRVLPPKRIWVYHLASHPVTLQPRLPKWAQQQPLQQVPLLLSAPLDPQGTTRKASCWLHPPGHGHW